MESSENGYGYLVQKKLLDLTAKSPPSGLSQSAPVIMPNKVVLTLKGVDDILNKDLKQFFNLGGVYGNIKLVIFAIAGT